jgi:hypothetical protein
MSLCLSSLLNREPITKLMTHTYEIMPVETIVF